MYKQIKPTKTRIRVNESYVGERIEEKVKRILNNNEPITDGSPLYYTERNEGVKPEFNIRTDKFELAAEAMDKVAENRLAKRQERMEAIKGGKDDKQETGTTNNDKTGTDGESKA